MKIIFLALLSLALGLEFNTHSSCTGHEAACTGTTGDATTCLGQDTLVKLYMAAEGIDITTVTTWTAATAQALARNAFRVHWDQSAKFNIHIDLEPIYRCTMEANSLTWAKSTACFDEWGSCVEDTVCSVTWDLVANQSKAFGVPFTQINHGLQALGAIPFTPIADATTSPLTEFTALQVGSLVAVADMFNNGKIMAMTACMTKDWVVNTAYPTGLDIQNAYQPCFDLAVECYEDALCVAAGNDVKNCAADKDVTLVANSMLSTLWEPAATASHDDWCTVSGCAAENGNSLFMAVGTCLMDANNLSYTKCYDDMTAQVMMLLLIIGGGCWVTAICQFTIGWYCCCRSKNKVETEV